MVIITSELFGSRDLGVNYMFFDGSGMFLGSIVIVRLITGMIYEIHAPANGAPCIGASCFHLTHVLCLCGTGLGVIGVLVVGYRSGPLYHQIKKLGMAGEAPVAQPPVGAVAQPEVNSVVRWLNYRSAT